jgi:tubulysin polyketide synthase-like protein
MNALQTLLACADRGVSVRVSEDGETLEVSPRENLTSELRAALRENKAEILTGKRPPVDKREILQLVPAAPGWYAIFHRLYGFKRPPTLDLKPLMCFALVVDETGHKYVDGVCEDMGIVGGALCHDHKEFSYFIGPGETDMGDDALAEFREEQRRYEAEYREYRKDPEAWRAWFEKLAREMREG